jgi:hypothetical protein
MKSANKNKQVAEKIIAILQSGLMLNADTQHYIDSTFSNPTVKEFEALLQDESSCETDSLIELLFFPDESVQLQLEEMIEDTHFQSRDEQEIKKRVCSTSLKTLIRFADGRGKLEKMVTPSNAARFIERLNLSRCLDPKLSSAIGIYRDAWIPSSAQPSPGMFTEGFKPDAKSDSATPDPSLHPTKFHSCKRFLKNCKSITMTFLIISIFHWAFWMSSRMRRICSSS